jgi:CRISPR/Cas system-associated exonuclease Cas4 (RecB family)
MGIISNILSEHANATQRVFAGGRSKTVGASEIGQCARKVWWTKHGAEHDPGYTETWGARTRGSIFENHFWGPALYRHYGANLKLAGKHQKTLVNGHLSATPDGIVVNQPRDALSKAGVPDIGEGQCFAVECKTTDPRANIDKAREGHSFQVQTQLGLVRELTPYQPEYALISYADASFWHDVKEFPVRFDPEVFNTAKTRAREIMTADSAFALPPEGWIAGGRECGFCAFSQACGRQRADVPVKSAVEPSKKLIADAVALAREFKAREAEVDAAEIRLRAARMALTDRLREERVSNIKADGVSIAWSTIKGRENTDIKALCAAASAVGIDVNQFSRTGESSERLSVRLS